MAKEAVKPTDDIERLSLFFPIKVVNGFVTCDFRLGCYCCKFCLNRRYPDWNRLLEMNRIYRNTLTPEYAAELLKRSKAFSKAKITLKIGHDTDMSLEEPEALRLYELLPKDNPIVFMRRGRLPSAHRRFYMKKRPNLLMKLTLTPRSEYLGSTHDPFDILGTFEGLACNMFFAVGPVCHDNFDEAKAIIGALPKGSKLWVRELMHKDIPGYHADLAKQPEYRGDELREYALEKGHFVVHYLNCLVRAELGLPFHKRGEFVSEPNTWQLGWSKHCKVRDACGREVGENEALARIGSAISELGLTLAKPPEKFGHKSYEVYVNEDVNFGDECFVRETTELKIDLYKQGRKTGTALSKAIVARWRQTDFFPVDDVLGLARESFQIAFSEDGGQCGQ